MKSEWQPIETAPRDGTRIWAYFPHEEDSFAVRFAKNMYNKEPEWTLDCGESATLNFDPPTHWTPLP